MNLLHERALAFENDVETHLVDERGLVRSALNIENMKPFEAGFFKGLSIHDYPGRNWNDFSEYMPFENAGMCTGAYMAAMVWKYRATKDTRALETAHRCFDAIEWLYKLSSQKEEGFFCKCYGGELSDQISSDQYLYTFTGLNEYMQFAPREIRDRCVLMIENMVRFWMRRNYSYQHFGRMLDWPLERFPAFSWLAFHYSGKKEFRNEFDRLCFIPEVMKNIPFCPLSFEDVLEDARSRKACFDFEKDSPLRCVRMSPECTQSGFLSLAPMLEYNAPHRELWLDKARKMFERDRRWIADDGYAMGSALYNIETGELSEVRRRINDPEDNGEWKFFRLVAWIRSGMHSAMFARASVALNKYFPNSGALDTAAFILEKLDRDKLRWFVDMDGKQMPGDLCWIDRTYSGDAVTNWLWAYWEACANYGESWAGKLTDGRNTMNSFDLHNICSHRR